MWPFKSNSVSKRKVAKEINLLIEECMDILIESPIDEKELQHNISVGDMISDLRDLKERILGDDYRKERK